MNNRISNDRRYYMNAQTGKKPITNKLLWIFAVGQFGWSLLSGIISTWLVHLYTGNTELGGTNGIFSSYSASSVRVYNSFRTHNGSRTHI